MSPVLVGLAEEDQSSGSLGGTASSMSVSFAEGPTSGLVRVGCSGQGGIGEGWQRPRSVEETSACLEEVWDARGLDRAKLVLDFYLVGDCIGNHLL